MGYNTSGRATQGRQAIEAAIGAIREAGRKARDRRAAIADDPVLALPTATQHRSRAYAEAEQEATAAILAARERGYQAAVAIQEEQEAWRSYGERPGQHAQVAGQRLQRILDAGVPLATVVQQAIATDDQDGLDWLAYNVRSEAARAVAAGGAPDRATAREVQRQADRLYEAITDARLPHLDNEARQYHADRRDLAKAAERLDAAARLAVAEAKGSPTTAHRFRAGLTEEPWASMVEQADHATWSDPESAGPVPEAVEA
jgi:hypothetical protein